jgi:acyloxyacyl hydrolase
MRERNLCNHRDYQNIGVNGGRTSNMAPPDGIISALQRTKADAPANVFYALIGNDVRRLFPNTPVFSISIAIQLFTHKCSPYSLLSTSPLVWCTQVCSGHEDFDHMTTPAEFLTYVTQALQYMDTQLAAGSAVLFAPLVDGRVLFNTLHNHTHPAGVLYSDLCVRDFLFEPLFWYWAS